MLGLQVDDLRFFARAADAGEQHIEKLSSQPRLVHIKGGERGVAVLCLGQVVESCHHHVARNALSQQFQGADDADGNGIVGADIALGDLGAGESARQFLGVAVGERVLLDEGAVGVVLHAREEECLAHGEKALVEGGAVGVVAHKPEGADIALADERQTEVLDGGETFGQDDVVIARDGEVDGEVEEYGGEAQRNEAGDIICTEQFDADDAVHRILVQVFDEAVEEKRLGHGELEQFDVVHLVEHEFDAAHEVDEEGHRHEVFGGDEHDAAVFFLHVRRGDRAVALISHLDGGGKHALPRVRGHILIVERLGDGIARERECVGNVLHRDAFLSSHVFFPFFRLYHALPFCQDFFVFLPKSRDDIWAYVKIFKKLFHIY